MNTRQKDRTDAITRAIEQNMSQENKIVHGLWIGNRLSQLELLCLHSFLFHGHEFHLWTYQPLETALPAGVIREDANRIIPENEVFAYRNRNQFGHGKGSYAGFSDIFRYKLLLEKGGWWVDMDVLCLSPLDFEEPYIFRTHHDFPVVGNVMKCPAGSPLMKRCYERAVVEVDADNPDWNLPIRILNEGIASLNLTGFIRGFSNQDSWRYIRTLLYRNPKLPEHWKVLHLVNEEWRRNRIDKEAIPRRSYMGKKAETFGILSTASHWAVFRNQLRILFPRSTFIQGYWFFARLAYKPFAWIRRRKGSVE